MNPIKVRAWHTKRKKMFSAEEMARDQLTLMPDGQGFINVHGGSTKLSHIYGLDIMIPLLYIGIKDPKNVDIYEGDVVEYTNNYGRTTRETVEFDSVDDDGTSYYSNGKKVTPGPG